MFISVVMPAYNAEVYLPAAIETVLGQSHNDFELIVVNDGSTDRTPQILDEFQRHDDRVRVISHENWGIVRSLNHAIGQSRAGWIARMDADDLMEPERLERQVAFVGEHPGIALTSCLVEYIDQAGNPLGQSHSELVTPEGVQQVRHRGDLVIMSHPGAMIRRDAFDDVGGYRPETWPAEDVDLFNRIADAGYKVLVQPEYLLKYRIHSESATGETLRMDGTLQSWLQQCSLNRRNNVPEPTMEEFISARESQPIHHRLNERRRDRAVMFYRRATFAYSLGRVGATALLIAGSSLLDPTYAPRQVWKKFVRPLVSAGALKDR